MAKVYFIYGCNLIQYFALLLLKLLILILAGVGNIKFFIIFGCCTLASLLATSSLGQRLVKEIKGQILAVGFLHHGNKIGQVAGKLADAIDVTAYKLILKKVGKLFCFFFLN